MHAKKRLADLPFEFNKEKNRMDLIMINECFTILCSMEKKKIWKIYLVKDQDTCLVVNAHC